MKKPKLTKWFDGSKFVPFHVGVYVASRERNRDALRFWNGNCWSNMWKADDRKEFISIVKTIKTFQQDAIEWRGLAQNPEVKP